MECNEILIFVHVFHDLRADAHPGRAGDTKVLVVVVVVVVGCLLLVACCLLLVVRARAKFYIKGISPQFGKVFAVSRKHFYLGCFLGTLQPKRAISIVFSSYSPNTTSQRKCKKRCFPNGFETAVAVQAPKKSVQTKRLN